jgi:hypothetical protein
MLNPVTDPACQSNAFIHDFSEIHRTDGKYSY